MTGKAYNNRCIVEWLHDVLRRHHRNSTDPRMVAAYLCLTLGSSLMNPTFVAEIILHRQKNTNQLNTYMLNCFLWRWSCWVQSWFSTNAALNPQEWHHAFFRDYGKMFSIFAPWYCASDVDFDPSEEMHHTAIYSSNDQGHRTKRLPLTMLEWPTSRTTSNFLKCLFGFFVASITWSDPTK